MIGDSNYKLENTELTEWVCAVSYNNYILVNFYVNYLPLSVEHLLRAKEAKSAYTYVADNTL